MKEKNGFPVWIDGEAIANFRDAGDAEAFALHVRGKRPEATIAWWNGTELIKTVTGS